MVCAIIEGSDEQPHFETAPEGIVESPVALATVTRELSADNPDDPFDDSARKGSLDQARL